ncbi:MAG: aerobic carbon-monoxide dehydrogenase medium subunit [Solirubrobacteraceae bacterium]|nr:aerobic carbon-monoxide dehydrogenase medium subunit [Solirubrobacteraceae bacterium]
MIASAVVYEAPASAEDATALLAGGDARVLAGGTWVVPELGAGTSTPRVVVDLRRAGLGSISGDGDGVRIGATVTYADLIGSPLVREALPLLHEMARGITGGWAIRAQGTIGGSLAAARPASDVPAVLVALGAVAHVASAGGGRTVPTAALLAGPMRTGLEPDELLTAVEIPAQSGTHGYVKLKRGASSWPIATAAALAQDGVVTRLVLGGVAGTPLEVDVARGVPDIEDPWDDELAPGSYRAAVAGPVAARAMRKAIGG